MSKARTVNGEGIGSLFPGSHIRPNLLKLKSYITAASGVVLSAGAEPRQGRNQNCRLALVPAWGRREVPEPRGTRSSHPSGEQPQRLEDAAAARGRRSQSLPGAGAASGGGEHIPVPAAVAANRVLTCCVQGPANLGVFAEQQFGCWGITR